MTLLRGKSALITGGNSGIGLATATLFAQQGARVIITGRNESTLSDAKRVLGDDHFAFQSDAANLTSIDRLFNQIASDVGRLDIMFLNAGIAIRSTLQTLTEAEFDRVVDTNLKGLVFTVQKALPHLNDGASIILNSSLSAKVSGAGPLIYSATKAAVRSLARGISAELMDRHIRCNAVIPGAIDTPIWGRSSNNNPDIINATKKAIRPHLPAGRFGTADEIAQAVLFLASDNSKYIIGSEILVDGGAAEIRDFARPQS